MYNSVPFANRDNLISFFSMFIPQISFFCFGAAVRALSTILKRSEDGESHRSVPDLNGIASSFPPLGRC